METSKDTNPKDLVGSDKLPLHLWPKTATALGCLGMLEGMLKYGRANFREKGIRITVYTDALERHLNAFLAGEDIDPESGLPHVGKMLSTLAVMVDAMALGNVVDDRDYRGEGYLNLVNGWTPAVRAIKQRHKDKNPKHYTIQDSSPQAPYKPEPVAAPTDTQGNPGAPTPTAQKDNGWGRVIEWPKKEPYTGDREPNKPYYHP